MRCSPSADHHPRIPCRQLWASTSHSRPNETSQARVSPTLSPTTSHQFILRCEVCRYLDACVAAGDLTDESRGVVSLCTLYFSSHSGSISAPLLPQRRLVMGVIHYPDA